MYLVEKVSKDIMDHGPVILGMILKKSGIFQI